MVRASPASPASLATLSTEGLKCFWRPSWVNEQQLTAVAATGEVALTERPLLGCEQVRTVAEGTNREIGDGHHARQVSDPDVCGVRYLAQRER
jgi:hypothetical protein